MDQVLERIAAWEAAGLIDAATSERLRAAEAAQSSHETGDELAANAAAVPARRGPSSVASIFGPGITIGEMFAYLGGTFLLGAYETFIVRAAGSFDRGSLTITVGMALAAIALTLCGVALRTGDARRRRAAGVMFALAVVHVGAAVGAGAEGARFGWPAIGVIAGAVATLAAFGYRLLHPSLLTQVAFLASLTTFAGLTLSWLESVVVPQPVYSDEFGTLAPAGGPDPILLVLASAAWWLALAVVVGLVGLREARTADADAAAGRRASLTRLSAGLVAVIGLATSVFRSGPKADGEYGRFVEPWVGDLAILILAAVLVERAFRRDASTFVYAAALGLMVALSDFNFTYLSSSTELGLLIEGVILLGAGVAADRLRRRIGHPEAEPELVPPVASA
jgi:hypothetical protein